MGIFEIITGVVLIVTSLVIIFLVINQEPAQQNGMSASIDGGGSGSYVAQGRGRNSKHHLALMTKIGAVVFFLAVIAVNVVKILAK